MITLENASEDPPNLRSQCVFERMSFAAGGTWIGDDGPSYFDSLAQCSEGGVTEAIVAAYEARTEGKRP